MFCLFCLTTITTALASLPGSVSPEQHIPGDYVSSVAIPCLDGSTLNPSTTNPLLIFALNSDDPFTNFMATSPTSIDDFLRLGENSINQSHFLFSAYHQLEEVTAMKYLFIQRLSTMSTALRQKWLSRLHFTNGTVSETLGSKLITTLTQWRTPLNKIMPLNITRLDCRYTYCPWENQNAAFKLVANTPKTSSPQTPSTPPAPPAPPAPSPPSATPCETIFRVTDPNSYMFLQITSPSCTTIDAAKLAIKAGAKGVVIAPYRTNSSAPPVPPVGHDADPNDPGLNVPVVIVTPAAGANIASALASTPSMSLSFATDDGIGQFVAIDGKGKLAEIGWEKYDTLRMLGWQAQWFEHQTLRSTQTMQSAFVIPVFDAAMTGTTKSITLPSTYLLRQFDSVTLDFSLLCPLGNMEEQCSVWDRIVSVTAECDEVPSFEIGRWINAFQRRGHWLTPTPLLPSSFGGKQCNFTFSVGLNNPWRASLNIRLSHNILKESIVETFMVPIVYQNPSESFTSKTYNDNKTMPFVVPKGTVRVELVSLITGHSGCEFTPTSHTFSINNRPNEYSTLDASYFDRYMEAGTPYGCANKIIYGATPNEHGSKFL